MSPKTLDHTGTAGSRPGLPHKAKAFAWGLARRLSRFKPIRVWLVRYYDRSTKHPGWGREHPFDVQYGIRTSGYIPGYLLDEGGRGSHKLGYTGSQPSIIRRAVALLPDKEITILVDLGCGKGRVLAVASEFPFREIIGVELSDTVAAIAEANMAVIRRNFPSRSPIQVVTGDAVEYPFPDAPLAIFLYNPFDEPLMRRLLTRIEAVLEQREQPITVIYYNPVSGAVLDASPWLIRAHALSLHCDESEEGFAPTATDSVVIWQDRRHASKPSAEALRKIVQVEPGIRVELAPAESTDQDPISASGIQPL